MKWILASASPRRRELLEKVGITQFEIRPAVSEEQPHPELSPDALVEELSRCKASEVAQAVNADENTVVIGADTVVVLDGAVLGKPGSEAEAAEMLRALQGRSHAVYTGVTVIRGSRCLSAAERTDVFFRDLTEHEIAAYIATGEPMDKAGAYGAQGLASLFVERIEGDFFNVMGLPLCLLGKLLKESGVELL